MPFLLALFTRSRALVAAGVFGLLLLAFTVWASAAQNDPAYFSDGWWMLRWIRDFERGDLSLLGYIFHPHGEHFHALILTLYLLDWNLFAGTQTSIAIIGYASSVAAFVMIAAMAARAPGPVLTRAAVIVFAAGLIASIQGFETWYLPFQAVLSTARLLACACIMLVAYGLVSARDGYAYAGFALASIAIFAHGTVMPLVFVIPGLPLLFRRWRLFAAGLIVPVGFLAMVVPYTLGLIGIAEHNSPVLFAPQRVLELLRGGAILIGGAFSRDVATALPIGAGGTLACVVIGVLVLRDILRAPARVSVGTVFFLGFGALAFADAFLAGLLAVLRANYFGPAAYDYETLLSSRYFMTATGVWVSLAALAAGSPALSAGTRAAWATAAGVAILAVIVEVQSFQAFRDIHQGVITRRGHAALLAEVYDSDTITSLIRPGDFQAEIPDLNRVFRERRRNIYAVDVPAIASDRIRIFGRESAVGAGCTFLAAVTVESPPPVARFDAGAMAYDGRGVLTGIADFDAAAYQRQNPDVARVLGADPAALWRHWATAGVFEGRATPARAGASTIPLYKAYSRKPCGALGLASFARQ